MIKRVGQNLSSLIAALGLSARLVAISMFAVCGTAAHAASPKDYHMIMVYLRGGADIGFQMIQPDLDSPLSLPLNRARPTLYDMNINNNRLTGTGYGRQAEFSILTAIHNDGQLAIVPRVGIDNMVASHGKAELAYAYGSPDADSSIKGGFLQRLALSANFRSFDLLDLAGGHPTTTAGGAFVPFAANQLLQLTNVDVNGQDTILFGRESGLRRDLFYQILRKTGIYSNAEQDEAQRRLAQFGIQDAAIRAAATAGVPTGYQSNAAGLLFRDAEMAIKYSRQSESLWAGGASIIFGMLENRWDTHINQMEGGGPLRTGVSQLNAAITQYRLNNLTNGIWAKTVIVVYTDMGRSTYENLQRGTDHGDANAVLVMGGPVRGGAVIIGAGAAAIRGAPPTVQQIQDKSGRIPRDFTWADVAADLISGMGYSTTAVWPGYSRRPVGLLN